MYYLVQHKVALAMLGSKVMRPKTMTIYAVSHDLGKLVSIKKSYKVRTMKIVYMYELGEGARKGGDRIVET